MERIKGFEAAVFLFPLDFNQPNNQAMAVETKAGARADAVMKALSGASNPRYKVLLHNDP